MSIPVCYIISNISGGGARKYLTDITNHYSSEATKRKEVELKPRKSEFIYIRNKDDLGKYRYRIQDTIFLQHFFFTDLCPKDILSIKEPRLVISIHDFHFMTSAIRNEFNMQEHHTNYLLDNIDICPDIKNLFDRAECIIHPSYFTYYEFSKYFRISNFVHVPHNDIEINQNAEYRAPIIDKTINVGVLHEFYECKGREFVVLLQQKYTQYRGHRIKYLINGMNIDRYEISDFYTYVERLGVNCLLQLNKWGETYCYGLSLALNTGLPIMYNNIGVYRERIVPRNHHFKAYESEKYDKSEILYGTFERMLNYIIDNPPFGSMTRNLEIKFQPFYDKLFNHSHIQSISGNRIRIKYVPTPCLANDRSPCELVCKANYGKNVILVSSKIYTSNAPLCGTRIRSIYSTKNRFTQTINTFTSIRKFIPHSFIIFIDTSDLSDIEEQEIRRSVDIYVKPTDTVTSKMVDEYPNKGRAELLLLSKLKEYVPSDARNLFKISARYLLSENFKYDLYDNNYNIFKKAIPNERFAYPEGYYFTCFYKISKDTIEKYFSSMAKLFGNFDVKADLETQLLCALGYDPRGGIGFREVDELGIVENISVMRYIRCI